MERIPEYIKAELCEDIWEMLLRERGCFINDEYNGDCTCMEDFRRELPGWVDQFRWGYAYDT